MHHYFPRVILAKASFAHEGQPEWNTASNGGNPNATVVIWFDDAKTAAGMM